MSMKNSNDTNNVLATVLTNIDSNHQYKNVAYRRFVTLLWRVFGHTRNELTSPRLAPNLSLPTYSLRVSGSNID
jgi:predicted ATPase